MQRAVLPSQQFAGARITNKSVRLSSSSRLIVQAAVKVGDKAPAFTLKDQDGRDAKINFGSFGSKPYVIFFYPKDATPGCTREAKAFTDNYSALKKLGAEVVGISSDGQESKKAFCDSLGVPFKLLSDEGDKVRSLYGVPKDLFGLLPGRQTYVIAKDGTVKLVYNNQLKPETHVEEAIKALAAK